MGSFVAMPKLGMTMEQGKITKWLMREGQTVRKGDYIFEVETDKTTIEVDSLYEGVLRKIYFGEMAEVPVNSPVAFIGAAEEDIPPLPAAEAIAVPTEEKREPTPFAASTKSTPITEPKPASVPAESYDFDLIVVGAGPGGYVAAIRAAQLGAKVAVAEKDTVGGTCLNRGCIPTKALYHCAKEWDTILHAPSRGFTVREASFDWAKIIHDKNETVKKLTSGVEGLLKKNGVKLIKGEAVMERPHEVRINGTTFTTANILLATGSVPVAKIKSDERLFNTDDILQLDALPASIVIIGGGVVGCEMANIFHTFGVRTTVVEYMPRILPMFDAQLCETLAEHFKRVGIQLYTSTVVERVSGQRGNYSVRLESGENLACELVLEAIGRKPNASAFSALGLHLNERGFVVVNELFETSTLSVYAIGDLNGISPLAHSASHQGAAVAEVLFGGCKAMEPQNVPSCVFSGLEIASVGKTLDEAKKEGAAAKEFVFPYAANGKALSMHASEGFVKVVYDETYGEILGVHIAGEQASVLIHEAAAAMRAEMTVHEIAHTIHAHPTLSETLMEAFLGCSTGAIHV